MQSIGGQVCCVGDLTIGQILGCGKEEEEEQQEALVRFAAESQMQRLVLLPNFQKSWLNPPSGWVAEFRAADEFSQDPFIGEKFKVFMLVELKTPLKEIDLPTAREALAKTIPLHTSLAPPTPKDKPGTGWTPALSGKGAFCGLYVAKETNIDTGERWDRLYAAVHTALPAQTLRIMEEIDAEAHQANYNTREFFHDLETARAEAGKQPTEAHAWDFHKKQVTYLDMFGPRSINELMRKLSVENATRLCCLVADAFQAETYGSSKGDVAVWRGQEEGEGFKEGEHYRDGRHEIPKEVYEDAKLLGEALKKWPRGVPIHTFHTINVNTQDYPLGGVLAMLREEKPPLFEELRKQHSIELRDRPLTARFMPDFVQDYNTYRILPRGAVAWYSNCSPGDKVDFLPQGSMRRFGPPPFSGVLQLQPLELGLRVAQASFMPPRMGGNQAVLMAMPPPKPPGEFATTACAVPCVFPFERDPRAVCQKGDVFFSKHRVPKLFQGRFSMRLGVMQRESVRRALAGIDMLEGKNAVSLEPVQVYCGDEGWEDARYQLLQ